MKITELPIFEELNTTNSFGVIGGYEYLTAEITELQDSLNRNAIYGSHTPTLVYGSAGRIGSKPNKAPRGGPGVIRDENLFF